MRATLFYLNNLRSIFPVWRPATRRATRFPTVPRLTALISPRIREIKYNVRLILLIFNHITSEDDKTIVSYIVIEIERVFMLNRFHCCSTCIWYEVKKKRGGPPVFRCSRLGYETKPTYQFDCWQPKERVKKRMEREESTN